MKSYISDFNVKSGAGTDAADLATALSGVSNGRNARFLNIHDSDMSPTGRGRGKSDNITDIILAQIPYEQYLSDTIGRIRGVQDTVDRALDIATLRFNQENAKLEDLEAMATTLPDGVTKVAMDKNGDLRTLDGARVDPDIAAQVEIGPHNPSFEAIDTQREITDQAHDLLMQIRQDELTLGELIEDTENGNPSRERLDEINDSLNDIQARSEAVIGYGVTKTATLTQNETQPISYETLEI